MAESTSSVSVVEIPQISDAEAASVPVELTPWAKAEALRSASEAKQLVEGTVVDIQGSIYRLCSASNEGGVYVFPENPNVAVYGNGGNLGSALVDFMRATNSKGFRIDVKSVDVKRSA